MKAISILGSTGSIGCNTLEVVRNLNRNGFPVNVKHLTVNSNIALLKKQIDEFNPDSVVITDENAYNLFKNSDKDLGCEILFGKEGLLDICSRDDHELVVNSLVGFKGLLPTITAIKSKKDIALANKETLVVAGELITNLCKEYGTHIFPIDSEHSAVLQCIIGEQIKSVRKITLTASGGPFRNCDKESLENVTVNEALNHPNWKMGNKITIDSSTLMNKGFEVIEAKWLFNIDVDKVEVLIHPQSIIHSLVEFSDGSVKAQLGVPDMKIPIQYSLTYPERINSDFPRLNLTETMSLTFEKPDMQKFECLQLAFDAIMLGKSYPVVLNAANEIAVELFLNNRIRFTEIPLLIKSAMNNHTPVSNLSLESIIEIDNCVRASVNDSVLSVH